MTLTMGTTLGRFEVLAPLGAGGMGEVFHARDTDSGREVALKIMRAESAGDPAWQSRFEREARLLASLDHPNIAAVLGLEEIDSRRVLIMELIPGLTLAERLQDSPLELSEALHLGAEIAGALAAAHDQGIIHRDLKPSNVKITPDGRIKVLDFGLAKSVLTQRAGAESNASPTLSYDPTGEGTILGTPAYMSPEQTCGKTLDRRADVWAFGCVLYEMLTGHRAFDGETVHYVLAAVLTQEPDWKLIPETVPPRVRELLHKCLRKEPDRRLRDLNDVRLELEDAREHRAAAATVLAETVPAQGAIPRSHDEPTMVEPLVTVVGDDPPSVTAVMPVAPLAKIVPSPASHAHLWWIFGGSGVLVTTLIVVLIVVLNKKEPERQREPTPEEAIRQMPGMMKEMADQLPEMMKLMPDVLDKMQKDPRFAPPKDFGKPPDWPDGKEPFKDRRFPDKDLAP